VIGTTGLSTHQANLLQEVASKTAVLYATNMSLGVAMLSKLVEMASRSLEGFDIEIVEMHHRHKKDAPSGTAVSLAQDIISNNSHYSQWELTKNQTIDEQIIPITALREPEVPGTHFVRYNSEIDTITLAHHAHNRKGFALGSVIAAEYLKDKKGLFTMSDVLNL
jgi:4-hydroxy-tetrahydrodipicolinate reductase